MEKFKQEMLFVWQRSKALLLLLLVITCFGYYFVNRYTISVNGAKSDCLKASVFLIDKWDRSVHNGDIVMFRMQIDNGLHPVGTTWAKKVAGLGGQVVEVDHYSVKVGQQKYPLATDYVFKKLKRDPASLKTKWVLQPGQLFMIGETFSSFDSRFWGPIEQKDVLGKAYAIF